MGDATVEANLAATPAERGTRGSRLWWTAIVVLGIALRLALMFPNAHRPIDDPDNYLMLARSIVAGQGFAIQGKPTAYRPPLYALALTPIVAGGLDRTPWGIWSFHLALSGATILFTAIAARRIGLSRGGVLIASIIVAVDPVLVAQARMALTETFAAFWVAAILAALAFQEQPTYRAVMIAGALSGLLGLCRPSLLPCAGLVVCVFMLSTSSGLFRRLSRSIVYATMVLVVMSPWAIRNARVFGEAIWTSSHSGYTLAMANNKIYYREILDGPPGAVWGGPTLFEWRREITLATLGMSEPQANRYLSAAGWRMMHQHPKTFFRASLARLGKFWAIAPAEAVYPLAHRIAVAVWTAPLWSALLIGLTRRSTRSTPRLFAVCFIVGLTVVHAFYWTDLRMRAPIVPAIALIASMGLTSFKRDRAKSPNI